MKLLSHVWLFVTPWTIYSLPGSSTHGIFQARILGWVAISFYRGSSQPGDRTRVSCIAGRRFTIWVTREAQEDSPQRTRLKSWHLPLESPSRNGRRWCPWRLAQCQVLSEWKHRHQEKFGAGAMSGREWSASPHSSPAASSRWDGRAVTPGQSPPRG